MKKHTTKRALLMSALSLLVCVSMLVGTTFAWFTDSVSSDRNIIQAGNLDITLEYWDGNSYEEVTSSTKLFNDNALWEPGHAEVAYLKIDNVGSLALKYQLAVNVYNETAGTNVANETFKLSDHLVFSVVDKELTSRDDMYTREEAVAAAGNAMGLTSYNSGTVEMLPTDEADYVALIIYMPTSVGNEANYKTGTAAPTIELGTTLVATQMASEQDSFGSEYDNISFPAPVGNDGGAQMTSDGEITLNIPDGAMDTIRSTGATTLQLVHTTPAVDAIAGTVTFESLELMTDDGIVDLAALGNTDPITVVLPVDLADGTNVVVYHDGVAVAATTVTDGKITYKTTHFCKVEVKQVETLENLPAADENMIQMLIGTHYYTVSKQFAEKFVETPTVPGQYLTAEIHLPQDLLAYSQAYKNGDLTETFSHSDLFLKADLDFTGINWTPIDRWCTNIHGNGYTISNLNNSLFGCVYDIQIDKLTLKNVNAFGSNAGVIAKHLGGDIFISEVTIAGENTVTYVKDSAENWPDKTTGVGAICGSSLIAYNGHGNLDVTVTGNIVVNYNDTVFSCGAGFALLGVSKEFGLNVYKPNQNTTVTLDGGAITTTGSYILPVCSFAELKDAILAGKDIVLGSDIEMTETISTSNTNFSLNGMGHTITMADGASTGLALFDITGGKVTLKNVTFDGIKGGAIIRTVYAESVLDNVTVQNCEHTAPQGLIRLLGKATVTNCTIRNNTCTFAFTYNYDNNNGDPAEPLVLSNCVFENNTCNDLAVAYYAAGSGATIDGNKFIGNTAKSTANAATVYLGFKTNCTVTNNIFKDNAVTTTGTTSRVAGALMVGNNAVVKNNAFVGNTVTGENAKANDVCASAYYCDIDLSGNYWGGNAPVVNDDYYNEYPNNYEVIINDYLTSYEF